MLEYQQKYIKYKQKYINLKNLNLLNLNQNQYGGKQTKLKIFDLEKDYGYKKGDLQNNLIDFEKKFGNRFDIKYKNNKYEIILNKVKLPNGLEYYKMVLDIPHRTTKLTPFIIDFFDNIKAVKNNNSYITNIQKTDRLSGTDLVKICLQINKILGAEKTLISDGAEIYCDKSNEPMDLSFIKLLEKDKTFYMGLGFEFEITNTQFPYYRIENKTQLENHVNKIIKNIRKIKTIGIIREYTNTLELMTEIITDNYKKKFEILLMDFNSINKQGYIYVEKPETKINEIILESKQVLDILNKYKDEKQFYKILVKIFRDNCDEYVILYKYIVENLRTQIIYGNNKITRDYVNDFNELITYRYIYLYSYTF